jgi:hypothetical protein
MEKSASFKGPLSRTRCYIGLLTGVLLILSSAAHSLLGWPPQREALLANHSAPELVFNLGIAWNFGGVAIFTFGCITLATFVRALRGRTYSLMPTALIGITYLAFGVAACVIGQSLGFLVFVVPGLLLVFVSLAGRARA